MAITDPQIVPSTLASDLDIISFTVDTTREMRSASPPQPHA